MKYARFLLSLALVIACARSTAIPPADKSVSARAASCFGGYAAPAPAPTFARPFTDGAVLQRDRPVPVWGRAPARAEVRVTYGAVAVTGRADANGLWRVTLPAMPASAAPRTLSVALAAAGNTAASGLTNVVIGEVWLCAGQSNMAMALVHPTMTRYRDGIGAMVAQTTDNPLVRYLGTPLSKGGWRAFTPDFLASGACAAIPVHYALELYAKLGVPVGVIVAAVGGCNIDAYLPPVAAGTDLDGYLLRDLYPYALRGALWYQGETNIYLGEVESYKRKMHRLYGRWREMFATPALSFYYVQLAPFARGDEVVHRQKDGTVRTVAYDTLFPRFLAVQAAFEKEEPQAAMTVINDLGSVDDIHPNEKWLVAKRLALHAFRRDYGFKNIEDHSPEVEGVTVETNVVTLAFSHAKTLYAYQRGQRFSPDLPFELADREGAWHPAKILNFRPPKGLEAGVITNNLVVLVAPGVARPQGVRYAWRKPWTGALYNEVNLPLGTFTRAIP